MIKMFKSEFMCNLQQPPRDNPWPTNPTNINFKTQFHRQCVYFLGFNAPKRKKSILKKNWRRNDANVEVNEAIVFAYNREMDQLVEANAINSEVKEEDYKTCLDGRMTKLDDKE
jgi:hypothetical protein